MKFWNFKSNYTPKEVQDIVSKLENEYASEIKILKSELFSTKLELKKFEACYQGISYENLRKYDQALKAEKAQFAAEKSIEKEKVKLAVLEKEVEFRQKYEDKLEDLLKHNLGCKK